MSQSNYHCYKIVMCLSLCLLVACDAIARSSKTQLSFAVNTPGTVPYLYYAEETDEYRGVVPDLFKLLEQNTALRIKFVDSHRNRSENLVYRGEIDMFLSSVEWISAPDAVIASVPLLEHRSFLYAVEAFSDNFDLSTQRDLKVCTRRGFTYPTLKPLFSTGQLLRIDSRSHDSMLKMLFRGRCDLAEINEHNANALLGANGVRPPTIYKSPEPTSVVQLSLLLHPSLIEQRQQLNQVITAFKQSGDFQRSLDTHSAQDR